ncbi:hypothetical protein SERLADRAFT_445435 [Serpula lacrymans var. lacrymans S7.9]|uniref:AAA+ ATPase domain-containing protein n=1 Tax=Serpula lacrymans var. lacrymans (strain S7.9) TaxID=578457 RepID=F8NH65_SERL9|nr:uncharacterized protein SERLADRAFT_445435 [Serpula lacrymans var. lacrymans S7.9]EGO29654.1 hypothetical protein SERLADRAFT_445435 [Serpula lacrymans var. lacrymans S7.9]
MPPKSRPRVSVDAGSKQTTSRPSGKAKLMTVKLDTEPPAKKMRPLSVRDDRLWVDMYEPTTEADLAVHKRKVEDVRRWFIEAFEGGPSGKLKKYRRILALTGPAGTAKTTTVRVLSRELGFEILEWRNSMNDEYGERRSPVDNQTLFDKFQAFLERASACHNIFSSQMIKNQEPQSSQTGTPACSGSSQSQSQSKKSSGPRHIILLEDLPNILHLPTQARFRAALQSLVDNPPRDAAPIVIIVSDAGMRGEAQDERAANGFGWAKEVVDVRTVLGPAFNPVASTLMKKAIQSLITIHFSSSSGHSVQSLPREVLDIIVESSNGDIRSAIMALQFACTSASKAGKGKKRVQNDGRSNVNARLVLEAVTRREQSLVLFHLMGKVLYNKRKGDPPNANSAAKDLKRDKAIDALLREPPELPPYLQEHERRASRVDIDVLYADSPIDSSLLGLYIHQNYTQFCNDIDESAAVAEWLSWADWGGGDDPVLTNPHIFHLLTLGTLHSLPSPVARRGQLVCKPEFFDVRKREVEAADAVRDVQLWVTSKDAGLTDTTNGNLDFGSRDDVPSTSRWSQKTIATELGGWLKAMDRQRGKGVARPPPSHHLFSHLPFNSKVSSALALRDGEDEFGSLPDEDEGWAANDNSVKDVEDIVSGGWLESDDIEEVE